MSPQVLAPRLRRWARRQRPGILPLWTLVACAWVTVAAADLTGHDDWFGHQRLAVGLAGWPVVAAWAAMALATMGPSSVPMARYVAASTLRPRRAVAAFFACYLAVWVAFFVAFAAADTSVHALVGEGSPPVTGAVTAVAFVVAAAWQLSRVKRGFVLSCRTVGLLPASGGAACRRLGVAQGLSCVGSCGPLMLATMAVPAGRILWMPLMALLAFLEKATSWRPRLARPSAAVCIGVGLTYLVAGVR